MKVTRILLSVFLLLTAGCSLIELNKATPERISIIPSDSNQTYLTLDIDELQILEQDNIFQKSNKLSLVLLLYDEEENSERYICTINKTDFSGQEPTVDPCGSALSIPISEFRDDLVVVLIVLDDPDGSLATEFTGEVAKDIIASIIAHGVISSIATGPGGIAVFAVESILAATISYAGGKLSDSLQNGNIIASQGLIFSKDNNWLAGNLISFDTENKKFRVGMRVYNNNQATGIPVFESKLSENKLPNSSLNNEQMYADQESILGSLQTIKQDLVIFRGLIDQSVDQPEQPIQFEHCSEAVSIYEHITNTPDLLGVDEFQYAFNAYNEAKAIFTVNSRDMIQNCRKSQRNPSIPFLQWGMARDNVDVAIDTLDSVINQMPVKNQE